MKFEYKILNMSEVSQRIKEDKKMNLLAVLNVYGQDGWELMFKLTDQSFLMKRLLPAGPPRAVKCPGAFGAISQTSK